MMTHVMITKLGLMIIVLMSPTFFPDLSNEINIYSLRTDSWKTFHDQLYGILLINFQGKHVNEKLHWIASTNEAWGSLKLHLWRSDTTSDV
ncbi:hypothetical protein H5410_025576 [Solanum commersonii]|uniref:Uncharacterized protein n=1 Tax=Solanum commersonii TaxID=4109 RepID=A0A9J5YYC5_SOLCO|nr:hypothetical protein H5410_025576 [Solanum commersonii]